MFDVPAPRLSGPAPNGAAYRPSDETLRRSNVLAFMRKHGIATYEELVARSTSDLEWFWGALEKELGIEWFTPYTRVLDESKGIAWPRWFVDGKLNLGHNLLDRWINAGHGADAAVLFEREDGRSGRWTYQDLANQVNPLCKLLRGIGVGKGDAVAVFMPMVPEAVAAVVAIAKVGAVFIPLFSGYGPDAVVKRLTDSGAKVLLTADGFRRRGALIDMKSTADEAAAKCSALKHTIVLRLEGHKIPWNPARDIDWKIGTCPFENTFEAAPVDSEHPFMIIYTSGTTGRPKGAVHVHGGFLVKIAQEVLHQGDLHRGDVLHWATDMGWIMGPWEVVGTLALGGTLFVYDGALDYPGPDRLWSLVDRHRVSFLGISPTLIRALMKHGDEPVKKHDLSSLRAIGSTGETWNPVPWTWCFERVGHSRTPIINLSGGTEIAACFLSALTIMPLAPCTLGGPALGMAVDVVDEQGRPLRGEVGELVCRRPWPSQTRGLFGAPERYIETYWSKFPNVWFHGDFASVDADGYWYLHGRSDDTIKIAGKRLGPTEVESILVSHPSVAESAAVGIPDEMKGECLWGFVVLKPGHEPTEALRKELVALVEKGLGKAFRPTQVKFARELPKTRNSKILRRAIRAAVVGGDPGDLSGLENPKMLDDIRNAS
jgi:acetyl-CoA synthetase